MSEVVSSTNRLKVKVFPYREKLCHGNITWDSRHQMRGGKFPASHPVGGQFSSSRGDSQCGDSEAINAFRDRGYWASCFPEGDGITWKPRQGQDDAQCLKDIQECFPTWDVRWSVTEAK